jgi:hypothetical protein
MRGSFLRLITLKWVLGRVKQELVFVERSVLSKRGGVIIRKRRILWEGRKVEVEIGVKFRGTESRYERSN